MGTGRMTDSQRSGALGRRRQTKGTQLCKPAGRARCGLSSYFLDHHKRATAAEVGAL